MKYLLYRSFAWIPVICVFILTSSQKEEDFGYLYMKLKGKTLGEWKATKMIPDKYVSEILQIAGTNGNTELWIQIPNPELKKTRNLEVTDLNHFTDEKHNMFMIQRGSISVLELDDQWIKGSFEFTATDNRSASTITAVNGYYKVPNPKRFRK
jgi:hypothetical protein